MGVFDTQALTALCCLIVGYFLASTIYQWHRLRHIPGPFFASFSYLWIGYSGWSGKQYEIHKHLGGRYGHLVRIGPNEVNTDDPETIRRISNAKSEYPRSGWYDGARFHPDSDAMFTMVEPATHDKRKAKTSHGYSGRETPGLESAINEQIENLTSAIRRNYVRKTDPSSKVMPLDLSIIFPQFTLDVISRLALGKEFGCLEADKDVHGFYHVVESHLPLMNVCADIPWARKLVFSSLGIKLFGPKPTDSSGLGRMMKLTNDEVHKRYTGDVKALKDMLGSFRRHGLTEAECQTEGFFMFVAGSETTASALRMILFHLIATPVAYNRLKKEMMTAIERGRVSNPITAAEAKELQYLQAVLYEGLRIRPVATATFGKEVPPGGDSINGYFVPGGTTVGPNLPSLMRSKVLFGEDADLFRPERFLEADEVTRTEMQRNVDLVFGYGRWMCAGKIVAWLELNKTIFEVLRHFDFQIYDPKIGIKSWSHGAWVDKDILVIATESDIMKDFSSSG
ncbi:cytochrome P450 [Xylaria bambusicola]|uniref:cytochrome P450 n=1 Tax=Xylaria bambusicola TaxID=326684 RepID=UPI0020084BDC|nr:cytochrome P450 [Xylaria bambusicola]KAI0505181.1 cytochrome P450 [Xylaria bambusicola]